MATYANDPATWTFAQTSNSKTIIKISQWADAEHIITDPSPANYKSDPKPHSTLIFFPVAHLLYKTNFVSNFVFGSMTCQIPKSPSENPSALNFGTNSDPNIDLALAWKSATQSSNWPSFPQRMISRASPFSKSSMFAIDSTISWSLSRLDIHVWWTLPVHTS